MLIPLTMVAQEEDDQMQIRGNVKFLNESNLKVDIPNDFWLGAMRREEAYEVKRKLMEVFKKESIDPLEVQKLREEYKIKTKIVKKNGEFKKNVLPNWSLVFVSEDDNAVEVIDVEKGKTKYDVVMKVHRIIEIISEGKAREVEVTEVSTDDADDGNERFRITIKIPAGTARTDSRLIIQAFAVDCQTEDTLDHCASLVYEGDEYHRMQERRMAFNYEKNDRLAKFYRKNAVLDEDKPFKLDTVIIWPKPSTMKDRSFRGPCVLAFEDYHHPYFFREMEGSCLKRRPFKMLDSRVALEDIELTDEFYVEAEEQLQNKNTKLDLRFEMGTSNLLPDSANAAEQSRLMKELKSYGRDLVSLTIIGAASPDGSLKRNQELAQQRANVAKQMLHGLPVSPSVSVKVYTWDDVVTQLKEQQRDEQAAQVQEILSGGGEDMALTAKMKSLPYYSLEIEPILNSMRAMSCKYRYQRNRVLSPEECVEEFRKNKKAYWEGTRHFSAGDFYHLYEMLEDSLELDTLTHIAYREISSETDYEIENAMAPYVCNRMAMIQIRRGLANVETLRPFIDLRRYGKDGKGGISSGDIKVNRWTASRGNVLWNRKEIIANQAAAYYMEQKQDTALFLVKWINSNGLGDDNTLKLEALMNLKKYHFNARNKEQEELYKNAKSIVLNMSDANKAILYTEIEEWNERKNAMHWVNKMNDDDPRKWYLKGILSSLDVDHEPPLIVTRDDDDNTGENDTVFYKWSDEKYQLYEYTLQYDDPKKEKEFKDYQAKLAKYRKDHDGQDPPMASAAQKKAKAETPVNVDMFKGIPQYLAYFQHCFDLDPTRKFLNFYLHDIQVSEDMRKKFKYKLKNRDLYRQMFKLLKKRDDTELPDTAVGDENGDENEDVEKKADNGQQPAEEKKEDQKA